MSTSELLVNYCYNSQIPEETSVIADYFGFHNLEYINLILNIYQGLVKYKGVSADELHKALKTKKLNELIHAKYKNNKSEYYNEFCEKNIIIGLEDAIVNDNIEDNDKCPNCGKLGYSTKNSFEDAAPDCDKCFIFVCKLCSHLDKKEASRTCLKCYSSKNKTKK